VRDFNDKDSFSLAVGRWQLAVFQFKKPVNCQRPIVNDSLGLILAL
jgi:hypothetical protein